MERKQLTIFTDGSCYWKVRKGGCGIYIRYKDEEYFILYDFVDKKVAIYPSGGVCYQGTIYFTSYALAQKAIKEAGRDNINKYIFVCYT